MADSDAPPTSGQNSQPFALQAAQSQFTQLIGKLASNSSSQSGDVIAALQAIEAAITAKPSS